jgi:hypothetical protein
MSKKTQRIKTLLAMALLMLSSLYIAGNLPSIVAGDASDPGIEDFHDDTYMYRDTPDAEAPPDGATYMLYWAHGGTWCDVEKSPTNWDDDDMCWAAAASNVLEWTGWGEVSGMSNTDQNFAHYLNHWTDQGGRTDYGWNWWFDGTNPAAGWPGWAQVDVPGGGDFWTPPYTYSDYVHIHEPDDTALQAIDSYLHNGWGTYLSITGPGGHAITCWGYTYTPGTPDYYTGIYITDSDDDKHLVTPPDSLRYYQVAYSGGRWYLQNYYGSNAWYIRRVGGLEPKPEPAFKYHFKFTGTVNVFHVNVGPGGWISGYMTGGPENWCPVLGKVIKGTGLYMIIDITPDESPGYYEVMFATFYFNTMSGQLQRTHDGMTYNLLSVNYQGASASDEGGGGDITEFSSSGSGVSPDAWYTFRLSPYIDIFHINTNPGGWLNGYDDVLGDHHPVLGIADGGYLYFGTDGLHTPYTVTFQRIKIGAWNGQLIRTEDGNEYDGPHNVWL